MRQGYLAHGRHFSPVEEGDSPLAKATGEHCEHKVLGRLTTVVLVGRETGRGPLGGEEENETALNYFAYTVGAQWNTDFAQDKTNLAVYILTCQAVWVTVSPRGRLY